MAEDLWSCPFKGMLLWEQSKWESGPRVLGARCKERSKMQDTPRIFVSHSSEDDEFCLRLIADLRSELGEDGIWYDMSGGLHGSDDWWDRILAEITERPYFLVVLSPNASASNWVAQEMKIAFRQHVDLGKRLLPVRLADSPRREDWRSIQEFNFTQHQDPVAYSEAFDDLLRALGVREAPEQQVRAADQTAMTVASPQRPPAHVERLAQETHTAYGREHWSDVIDKTNLLISWQSMTIQLWRERASAAFALNDPRTGLAAVEEALKAEPSNLDTHLLRARLLVRAGDDTRAVAAFTAAYALIPLDDIDTRLLVLDDMVHALARLKSWEQFTLRVGDARRMAPEDPKWRLLQAEGLLATGRIDEALAALKTLPRDRNAVPLLPAWNAALAEAVRTESWAKRKLILDAASAAGVDTATLARWRRIDYPHFHLAATQSGHSGSVLTVAWDADGTRIASGVSDGTVFIWPVASALPLTKLSSFRLRVDPVHSVAWSPDGTHLAISGKFDVRIWAVVPGKQLKVLSLPGFETGVKGVAWSPDGTRLAVGSHNAYVWDISSGKRLLTVTGPKNGVLGVAWSPDGSRIAFGTGTYQPSLLFGSTDTSAYIWDVARGEQLVELAGHSSAVYSVSWSPDGSRIATVSADKTARTWEASSGKLLMNLVGHTGWVKGVSWSPDGTRIATAGSDDNTVRIWDAATGKQIATLFHQISVDAVAWSPNSSQLATAGGEGIVRVWKEE